MLDYFYAHDGRKRIIIEISKIYPGIFFKKHVFGITVIPY